MDTVRIWVFRKFDIVLPGVIAAYYDHDHYQLSDELLGWIEHNKSFRNSLKLRHPTRFKKIPYLITSHTPFPHPLHKDQIIGLWYLDLANFIKGKHPYFKQDFIVNKEERHKIFISFAQKKYVVGNYVESIETFFVRYGNNGAYYHRGKRWQHHYNDIADLPNTNLQNLAKKMIKGINSGSVQRD